MPAGRLPRAMTTVHAADSKNTGKTAHPGEVAEWSNAPDSKSGIRLGVSWVRIPPSPPDIASP
ncbi:hypothetical protein AZ27_3874 [Bordetella bronchiseptica D756]|nr:hypothetical protein AZ27_3874 [Bordetella bronchiseptica D756]